MVRIITRSLVLVAVLVAVVGCAGVTPAPAPTPASGVLTAPTPAAQPLTTPAPEVGDAAGRLPAVLARVTTAAEIVDVLPDASAGRVYVNDAAGTLYAFDTQSYELVASLQAGSGPMTLDAPNGLLFVVRALGGSEVSVVDTTTLTLEGTIEGGECVAVDSAGHRAFVGSPQPSWPAPPGEVQVWDTRTFQRIGAIAQGGLPAYNPLRDEVYISAYSVFIADGKSLAVTGLLTPDIDPEMTRMCRGCWTPGAVLVDPAQDAIMVPLSNPTSPQLPDRLRLFSARTGEPVSHTVTILNSPRAPHAILPPAEGRVYEAGLYGLAVYQAGTSEQLDLRDGLRFDYYLPGPQVILSLAEPSILAFDAHTLELLGSIPYEPIHRVDPVGSRLYAWAGAQMTVLSCTGGAPQPPEPAEAWPAGQPFEPVRAIHVSPAFARDRTVFVTTNQDILRSTDGGASWACLHGGLPTVSPAQGAQIYLAVSPAYADDHTLFAGGTVGYTPGLGVWRSSDGGDTWQPAWQGLRHLRVYDLVISPAFAADRTLFAYCAGEGGPFLYRSQDGGDSWALFAAPPVVTPSAPGQAPLPSPEELLPAPEGQMQFRTDEWGKSVLRSGDGGRTWQTVLSRPDSYARVEAIVPSPRLASDRQVFALYEDLLYRSADGGDTWQVADDDLLVHYDYHRAFTALAVAEGGDGQVALFLGDYSGAVLRVDPDEVMWAARPRPTPTPTLTPTPPPTATPVPPPPDPIADLTATAESPGSPACGDVPPLLRAAYERWHDRLGCKSAPAVECHMIIQHFEHGFMVWLQRGDLAVVYALVDPSQGGGWYSQTDYWQEGDPEPVLQPPAGLLQPLGGFGRMWRELMLQSQIGWAVDGEQSYDGLWQSFYRQSGGGELLSGPDGQVYALFSEEMKWASE